MPDVGFSPQPEYRPFTLEESGLLQGRTLVSRTGRRYRLFSITMHGNVKLFSLKSPYAQVVESLDSLLTELKFEDGSPVGVKL